MRFYICKADHHLLEDRGAHAAVFFVEDEDIVFDERNNRLTCRIHIHTAQEMTKLMEIRVREILHLNLDDGTVDNSNVTWYYDSIKHTRKTTILWLWIARQMHLPRDVAKLIGLEILKTRYSREWLLLLK